MTNQANTRTDVAALPQAVEDDLPIRLAIVRWAKTAAPEAALGQLKALADDIAALELGRAQAPAAIAIRDEYEGGIEGHVGTLLDVLASASPAPAPDVEEARLRRLLGWADDMLHALGHPDWQDWQGKYVASPAPECASCAETGRQHALAVRALKCAAMMEPAVMMRGADVVEEAGAICEGQYLRTIANRQMQAEASLQAQAREIGALVSSWRSTAATLNSRAHFSDCPYDDQAHEHRTRAAVYSKLADEMAVSLKGQQP